MKWLLMATILLVLPDRLTWAHHGDYPVSLTVGEAVGYVAGIVVFFLGIMGFFVKRTVFQEIDMLKETKQDKVMCDQIEGVACKDREEIKAELKDGKKEFKLLHQKIDRIMWAMKLPPPKEEDDEGNGV